MVSKARTLMTRSKIKNVREFPYSKHLGGWTHGANRSAYSDIRP